MQESWVTALIAVFAAFFALFAAFVLSRWLEPADSARRRRLENRIAPTSLLYRGEVLVDATPPARALLSRLSGTRLTTLLGWLESRLPGTIATLARLPAEGRVELAGAEGRGSARLGLLAEDLGDGMTRLTLTDPVAESAGIVVDSLSQAALEEEAAVLRDTANHAPMLSWRQDRDGHVLWANSAYLTEAEARCHHAGLPIWPLPMLFDLPTLPVLLGDESQDPSRRRPYRARLETAEGTVLWFDCHLRPSGSEVLFFAIPADDAVRAERSLREFVQTLTKTFADLPIGLAIFDRQRQLQLFNPALIDLTGLQTSFLTARPSLFTFLDRMREARMVPEPRDYRSWRKQMSTLEAAAASGHHVETWSLPGGQTYRVTGRPHPDGAVAFLFEDITSEMSLTRRFREQLSLGTTVIDALDEAIGVFAPDGQMMLGNDAWRHLWGDAPLPLCERLRAIESRQGGSAGLKRLVEALSPGTPRSAAVGAMGGPDGRLLTWRLRPLPGGLVMVGFSPNLVQQGMVPHDGLHPTLPAEVAAAAAG